MSVDTPAVIKRTFDIVLAGLLLVLFAPVLAMVALAVRFALGSPVVFRQTRPGLNGEPFVLIKFRTMRDLFDKRGNPLADARRLTPFGRFLRSTSLDELPELWNVLRGDMSLVGPRPLLMEYLPRYSAAERRRHEVRPGITGWAQVNGRNATTWEERFAHDLWYVEHHTVALDLQILFRTLGQVFAADGIAQPGHATMPRYTGHSETA